AHVHLRARRRRRMARRTGAGGAGAQARCLEVGCVRHGLHGALPSAGRPCLAEFPSPEAGEVIVKTRTLFLTGAALALLAASEASAVPMYCTTGSLNACASVVVEKYGDMVMVRVRNLQGQVAADNTWYSGIRSLQLYMRGVQGFSDFS